MNRLGMAGLLLAASGALLAAHPAEGLQRPSLAPRIKGVVISRSDLVLSVDQVVGVAAGQPRTSRVVLSAQTHVGGRRSAPAAIRVQDLVRADGLRLPDGSLEAFHVEVVLTAEEVSIARPARGGPSSPLWDWILNGGITIPLP